MRDEWKTILQAQYTGRGGTGTGSSSSSQGLTRRQTIESAGGKGGGDRIAALTMAQKGMKLKAKGSGWDDARSRRDLNNREVSSRRQVGDAADEINSPLSSASDGSGGTTKPWWRNVTMEEGI